MQTQPTPDQLHDLATTLALIEESRKIPVEMANLDTFLVWEQNEFVRPIGPMSAALRGDVLDEGACGTAACLCGARALMDGAKVLRVNGVIINGVELENATDWFQWGAERFGIDHETATVLFAFDNTMRQLRYYVAEILAGHLPLEPVLDYELEEDGWEA